MCAMFLHTSPLFLHTHFNILFVMAYKKNPKKKDALSIKRAVESLCFQIDWGLKLLGAEKGDLFHQLAKVEVEFHLRTQPHPRYSCYQEPRGWSETKFTDRCPHPKVETSPIVSLLSLLALPQLATLTT